MAGENLKTTMITNLDATPAVRDTSGKRGDGLARRVMGFVSPATAMDNTSTYRMVRVPSNCFIKEIETGKELNGGTLTTFTGDITCYYSSNSLDEVGSSAGLSGLVNSKNGASSLFAQAHAYGSDTDKARVDVTNAAGNFNADVRSKELWDALGLSSDPGGFFDIVIAATATSSITGAPKIWLEVTYVHQF